MSVYQKILEVQKATRALATDAKGQTGAASYNYVSGNKVLGQIRPIMDKIGLLLLPEVIGIDNKPISYMTRNGEKTEMFTTVHMKFTWVDAEDGSNHVALFSANGMNAWDKGLGSALTYGERYYLMKTFHIATDEDDVDALVKDEAIAVAPAEAGTDRSADLAVALLEADNAGSTDELNAVWKKHCKAFGKNIEFIEAIKANPNHPSHKNG